MTHTEALARIDLTTRKVTNNIMSVFGRATEDQILEGKVWYAEAQALAAELSEAGDITVEQAGIVIAQLSPRLPWDKNVSAARALVAGEPVTGVIGASIARAMAAMATETPWDTFGKAPKTRAFAANIIGDDDAVTVDVWACRVAGITEQQLTRVGVYDAVAHCYRLAAKRAGIAPAAMQAITWIVQRGSAA
ncbi:DUF7178 family protein [Nocardia sp. NPDC055002]